MPRVEDYRLTQGGKNGLRISPLLFRPKPAPIVGESLLGLIARTANRNGITSLARVFGLADIPLHSNGVLPQYLDAAAAERIAFVLKTSKHEVEQRLQSACAMEDRNEEFCDFFGVHLPAHYRERKRRRVSPRALQQSPHHRAIHELRVFSFCPETLEILLDTCPACDRGLGWRTTYGIHVCEHCMSAGGAEVDLRDHPQALVQVDDVEALRIVPALVDPDPAARQLALAKLHPDLAELGPGPVFELAIGLSRAIATPDNVYRRAVRGLRGDFDTLTPELHAQAGRVLLEWPDGLYRLAEEMRSGAAQRTRTFGLLKELGGLAMLTARGTLPEPARALLARCIQTDLDLTTGAMLEMRRLPVHRRGVGVITSREAAARLGACQSKLGKLAGLPGVELARRIGSRTAKFYSAEAIDKLASERRDAIYGAACARQLGIPLDGLEELAKAGFIDKVEGPVLITLRSGSHFERESVERLTASMLAKAIASVDTNQFRFDLALRRLPRGPRSWVDIVRAIGDRSLPVVLARGKCTDVPLLQRLYVQLPALRDVVMKTRVAAAEEGGRALSYPEAALYLAVHNPIISQLVRAGLLATSSEQNRRIDRIELDRFAADYMMTAEAAQLLRTNKPRVRGRLAAFGILPVVALNDGGRLVYRRNEVEPLASRSPRLATE